MAMQRTPCYDHLAIVDIGLSMTMVEQKATRGGDHYCLLRGCMLCVLMVRKGPGSLFAAPVMHSGKRSLLMLTDLVLGDPCSYQKAASHIPDSCCCSQPHETLHGRHPSARMVCA